MSVKNKKWGVTMNNKTEIWSGLVWDRRLSPQAVLLMSHFLSQDDDYDFSTNSLCKELCVKKHELTRAIRQLKRYGYIQDYNGGHIIHEIPQLTNPKFSRNPDLIIDK